MERVEELKRRVQLRDAAALADHNENKLGLDVAIDRLRYLT